ncbi:predicted protein [Phaeodactylum tricornutum CCAP 1055/1]|uniref:ubiquitinyl hydrolase 1 n=1 Tax=Phaeodactylum tricornutum (strain CCAP 1055/1) TaxID=556484 RepID=B7G0Q8_PHATC|nr:predicted protein [Phaeodactylum tricornutum CCAP 1055/1]EEC48125.1 predicted protein [Phaeodactylum tricornutum CCAP 1055/1]|eukprot:XP_002180717.1 predicted protein [Phaeodactylum tricornutum CCAP 1055/1]
MTDKSTANYPIVVVDVDDDTTDGENDEVSTIVRTRIDTASPTTSPIRPHTPLEEAVHGGLRLTRTRRTYHETAAPPSSPVTASSPPSTPLSFTAQAPKKRKAPVVHEPYSAAANMRAAMELAKYELLVDPYRGMTKLRDAHHDEERDETDTNGHVATSPSLATVEITPRPSPWQTSCAVAIPESGDCRSPTDDGDDIANWEAADIVKRACNCSCPSLTSWTSALAVARDKKRKKSKHQRKANSTVNTHVLDGDTVRIGQRPDGHAVRCPCDYNPFCLVSLGGVVNEILVDRYKELETKNDRAGNGEVEEVVDDSSVTNDAEGPVQPNRIISDATQEDMNAVRRSISVRVEPIRSYLEHTLQDLTPALTLEDCISRIRKRHAALIFVNPLLKEKADSPKDNDALVMSIPPGMQNLGATCYLNTQLQCLAQNLVFLEGVLSWRPPTSTVDGNANPDPIPQMIETFQSLLASMRIGPHYVLNTKDFSNALRLDHYEQQDPNEFSRLLLDCIQQSFQSATQQRDLATLLPHLFHGKTTYTTTCQVCHKMSTTTENFMDVTLPIVKPLREKSMPGQQSLADAFGKSKAKKNLQSYDTDVQYCWDRYVYDRNRGTKKKVTDKVLLPTELEIEQATTSAPSTSPQVETEPTKHRGHYVAEAMDWQTGQWFEFNDAHVTLLEAPSCSWDPLFDSDRSDDRKKDTKETKAKKGSEDAYNMYYVEESFLAQSVLDSIREIDPQTGASKSESEDGASALKTAALTRSEYFADLRRTYGTFGNL